MRAFQKFKLSGKIVLAVCVTMLVSFLIVGAITYTGTLGMVNGMASAESAPGDGAAQISAQLDRVNTLLYVNIAVIAVIIVASMLVIWLLVRRIVSRPIKALMDASDRLALGDIDVSIEAASQDEIGALSSSLRTMIESIAAQVHGVEQISAGDLTVKIPVRSERDILGIKLNEMIRKTRETLGNINTATEQVAGGAGQVSNFSLTLSQGATEQAGSIEQLSGTAGEIAEKTRHNAENADEASKLTGRARLNAAESQQHMQNMLSAMDDINASSGSISKIIRVIDDIAFQTNILALNAAVEAARAGQHGKGFAVVADEVRSLASRSAGAARETTELIEGSVRNIEDGTRIARETASSLNRIVEDVAQAAALVGDIAASSNAQAEGIRQINQALQQVSAVVQSNSATSEESAAASEELSAQAEFLKSQVESFRLGGSAAAHAAGDRRLPAARPLALPKPAVR
ncbi:Methyl-accepting chemotaxis protein [Sporobacter termitidis DSM 10068]|uniref:Methyl-accepting chemotaxis protein n=1 Tax=Sporobacter termitidis DSM 10068 TaxID=1123282 RepID=A0A1M5Y4V0_9FIRM|nr:HAMP domain-containing methyl-accepting chemotaxis protein [Sporobacter termitidis]SHI07125.1 Methyl-accepting chemotaxis protein [Sporobacter termitidis DSM 10068]